MRKFSLTYFEGVSSETFVHESAGVADLITSCLGGRNRRCAESFVTTGKVRVGARSRLRSKRALTCYRPQSFDELEEEMLGGQKLQGCQTAKELHGMLDEPVAAAAFR